MSNPIFVPALVIGEPLVALPGTAVISGSVVYKYVSVTATYAASDTDKTINCTAGTFTVTLPTAVGITGREYFIKNTGAGVITVDADGSETIDGALTFVLQNDGDEKHTNGIAVLSTGAGWISTSKTRNAE